MGAAHSIDTKIRARHFAFRGILWIIRETLLMV